MYYRIATRRNASPSWQWESRVIASPDVLFRVLKLYRTMPRDDLRVFFSSSVAYLDLMLDRENEGLESNSLIADRLLHDRRDISQAEMTRLESVLSASESRGTEAASTVREQSLPEKRISPPPETSMSFLDMRRLELELSAPGDQDTPYKFTFPSSLLQTLVWAKLLARIYRREFQP